MFSIINSFLMRIPTVNTHHTETSLNLTHNLPNLTEIDSRLSKLCPESEEQATAMAQLLIQRVVEHGFIEEEEGKSDSLKIVPPNFFKDVPILMSILYKNHLKIKEYMERETPIFRFNRKKTGAPYSIYYTKTAYGYTSYINFGQKKHRIGIGASKCVTRALKIHPTEPAAFAKEYRRRIFANVVSNEAFVQAHLPSDGLFVRYDFIGDLPKNNGNIMERIFMPLFETPLSVQSALIPLSENERISIAKDVLYSLVHFKKAGFIHMDLMPRNILLKKINGIRRAFIGDFGEVSFSKEIWPEKASKGSYYDPWPSNEKSACEFLQQLFHEGRDCKSALKTQSQTSIDDIIRGLEHEGLFGKISLEKAIVMLDELHPSY